MYNSARAGSQGIKNKNIKILDGMPLVEHTIKFSKKLKNILMWLFQQIQKKF